MNESLSSPSLSGQQIQALAKQHATELAAIRKDIELRKWAMDQACSVVGAANEAMDEGSVTFHDPVSLARSIHAFLVEGAGEKGE
jgi:hypothetical protein